MRAHESDCDSARCPCGDSKKFGRQALSTAGDSSGARSVLTDQEPTEEAIMAALEADGVTIEEAEAEVR